MSRTRNIVKSYNISSHRFYELLHFCLQYNEWKWTIRNEKDSLKSPQVSGMPKSRGIRSDPTAELAIRLEKLEHNCRIIEESAKAADESLADYILYAVTNENITYNYLSSVKGIPCSKNTWYTVRRKFYYILDRKKDK